MDVLFEQSRASGQGASIPEIIEVVLGYPADEEITELVTMAMEDSREMSSEDIADGIIKLQEWRDNQS
ncbi:uncharacterized protein METZ01_LOCUS46198 [marine metagenome]|uniref:Uncharacterized protein n=1 Tax=marine metagenome TaxID=408172 RepID=A0A381RQ30_9ZZZZ